VAEFRRAGLSEVHIGPGTRLSVAVKQPEAAHEVQFAKLQERLEGGAKSPNEQVTKARLREVLGWQAVVSPPQPTSADANIYENPPSGRHYNVRGST
jgi:hypothetical protein